MSDERLLEGRHHLVNGRRALDLGFPEAGRRHFGAALLRFRSPELRLGEAHAMRGLAEACLAVGEVDEADVQVRAALEAYTALPSLLDAFESVASHSGEATDPARMTLSAVRAAALEGEAACWALLGEVLSTRGRHDEAEQALDSAAQRFGHLRDSSAAASVYMAHGRVELRAGRPDAARGWFERALTSNQGGGSREGEVTCRLALAELLLPTGELDEAEAVLRPALALARDLEQPALEARVLCCLGELSLVARRHQEARTWFEDAVPRARDAGDVEREGQALVGQGTASGHLGEPQAATAMYDGIRLLAKAERDLPLAAALLRLGNHARRVGAARLALACASIALRIYTERELLQGRGQALRTLVKALAMARQDRATLMAAIARDLLVGAHQPNAGEVRAWYSQRAPQELVDELSAVPVDELLRRASEAVLDVLEADLDQEGIARVRFGERPRSIGLVETLVREVAAGPPPQRLSVKPVVARSVSAPTETPAAARVSPPTEVPDDEGPSETPEEDGQYQSMEDVYGSLYDT